MILKTAANYNDEGGYIEAWKNSDGTTEVKLIPKSGGDGGGKQGLKSISISPTVTTEPAIDSVFPFYYEDLTEVELQNHSVLKVVTYEGDTLLEGEFSITFTPTADWYASQDYEFGGKGEPVTHTAEASPDGRVQAYTLLANSTTQETATEYFSFTIVIEKASSN